MGRQRKPKYVPPAPPVAQGALPPPSILELDRFAEADVHAWNALSADLDELNDVLYFGLEPERHRHRAALLAALGSHEGASFELTHWARLVTYRYGDAPLSAAGSLAYVGGRFNVGLDLDGQAMRAWPALYIAEDYETAFREKFQRAAGELTHGLTPEELSLNDGGSHSTVMLRGRLSKVFDLTTPASLMAVARVFAKIALPARAEQIKRKLKMPKQAVRMLTTAKQLHDMCIIQNWRVRPVQFELPANTHTLAELIRAAGFEAILYPSTKGSRNCLAVFPDRLLDGSYIELEDEAPPSVLHRRLDASSADELTGWSDFGRKAPE